MIKKIEIGDVVRITKGSEYYGQSSKKGRVICCSLQYFKTFWFDILFDDGYVNNYRDEDVEIIKNGKVTKNKIKEYLLKRKTEENIKNIFVCANKHENKYSKGIKERMMKKCILIELKNG